MSGPNPYPHLPRIRCLLWFPSKGISCLLLFAVIAQTFSWGEPESAGKNLLALLQEVEEMRYASAYEEGMAIAEKILAEAREAKDEAVVAEAIYQIALLHYFQEQFDPARANLEIGYNLARQLDLEELQADFLGARGVLEWKLGNLSTATEHLKESLNIFQKLERPVSMASTANNLGLICYSLKQYGEAIAYYEKGLEFLGDADKGRLRASLFSNLAEVLIPSGELERAEYYLDKSLAIEEELQEPRNLAYTYYNFGELRSKQGNSELALQLYEQALELQVVYNDAWGSALTRLRRAEEYWRTEQAELALEELEKGFHTARELNALSLLRDFARLNAEIRADIGQPGLSKYYANLADWFESRIQEEDTAATLMTGEIQTLAALAPIQETPRTVSTPIRAATVIILCILITILVIENIRLRKRMNRE